MFLFTRQHTHVFLPNPSPLAGEELLLLCGGERFELSRCLCEALVAQLGLCGRRRGEAGGKGRGEEAGF
jgi:hypothetical protein